MNEKARRDRNGNRRGQKKKNGKQTDTAALHRSIKSSALNTLRTTGGAPFNHKQLAARLGLNAHAERDALLQVLEELVEDGYLDKPDPGHYRMAHASQYVIGKVDATKSGGAFIIVEGLPEDIVVQPAKMGQALHGDIVKVLMYARRKGKRPEGEVVELIERVKTEFTGVMQIGNNVAFFLPDNKRISVDFFVPQSKLGGAVNGDKVQVKLLDWQQGAKSPAAEVIRVLGRPGQHSTEMNAIIAEFELPEEFPQKVIDEANAIGAEISEEEIARRKDMRGTLTFTIDPADAKDFDDALSFKEISPGKYEIGVHIADVSHYVKPGTALDTEALERATSVYLVDRVIPMLPENLSNGLCSLRPDEEKLTFSAVFVMNENAEIEDKWFGRSIIKSARRFAYEEAQEVLEGKPDPQYGKALHTLNHLAHILRERKFEAGAISFETEEVKFILDDNGHPTGIYKKVRKDAHKLIEDFMLLANRSVAEFMYKNRGRKGSKKERAMVYRSHEAPDEKKIQAFAALAAQFGYKLNMKTPKTIARSITKILSQAEHRPEVNMLGTMAIRSMAKAIYTTEKTSHYGLAFDFYTHFTSPIRRYPDVMAHRLLADFLEQRPAPSAEELESMARHSTEREIRAAEAERASVKYKQVEYMADRIGQVFDGIISGVTDWGIYVELIESKCEGMVRLSAMRDDHYVFEEERMMIRGINYGRKYTLGDPAKVRVEAANLAARNIDFSFAEEPEPQSRQNGTALGEWEEIAARRVGEKHHAQPNGSKSGGAGKSKKGNRRNASSKGGKR